MSLLGCNINAQRTCTVLQGIKVQLFEVNATKQLPSFHQTMTTTLTPGTYVIKCENPGNDFMQLSGTATGSAIFASTSTNTTANFWNVFPTLNKGWNIQSYLTGDFAAVVNGNLVTSSTPYSWTIASPNPTTGYAYTIQDTASGLVLGITLNGSPVTIHVEAYDLVDNRQAWFFVATEVTQAGTST
ncbi:hypothetical protein SERLA73DRAFT_186649 [Serpula lacrymans var. lacrymans S7.3]|uniref:Ricin B lectin domain-containing protein n=2 Tax=Serpula lacrymans var. lacrymans TaxID=341189 RepID=F8Q7M7_SERL3|nr:uncharacterized protein SERLADRAFT_475809 [Serpula lacrymans var. lacrymans S7.9]EGN95565.1 hypothetical protein SERLA73DRAFT_186649 [Serpula lacrymans var. lacrymans S7.3]EGO21093.1 hypothetical protein SERLADRAFT_475809 [Serpula lacrymans var. lacrymans S7.9]